VKFKQLHSWRVGYKKAVQIQETLKNLLIFKKPPGEINTVAGADVSYDKHSNRFFAGVVVFKINKHLEIIEELVQKYEVIHQTGGALKFKDFEMLTARAGQLPKRLQNRYKVSKWLNSDELAEVYSRTSLLVGRSGANTVSEVAALGVPALFIPLPWAGGDEQEENAKMLESLGAALVLHQERLTPKRLLFAINSIINNLDEYKKKAKQAKKIIQPNASKLIVDEAIKLLNENKV